MKVALTILLMTALCQADELDALLDPIDPKIKKWASVCRVTEGEQGPECHWAHYRESATAVNFWPASTIKIYPIIAVLERMEKHGFPLDTKCAAAWRSAMPRAATGPTTRPSCS